MKKISLPLICILLTISLFSCKKSLEYRTDISPSDIADEIIEGFQNDGGYAYYDDAQFALTFDDDVLSYDYCAAYSLISDDIDEFGIFRANSENEAKDILEDCKDYLEDKYEDQQAFISSYAPEELPKLKHAEAKRFGIYTVYAIMNENDRETFFSMVEEMLR